MAVAENRANYIFFHQNQNMDCNFESFSLVMSLASIIVDEKIKKKEFKFTCNYYFALLDRSHDLLHWYY
jgi:hypothetical protein